MSKTRELKAPLNYRRLWEELYAQMAFIADGIISGDDVRLMMEQYDETWERKQDE